ncbi:hypothetical protein KAH55_05065, partial [bacterium]|nr:hypothetical protein [bacterium]
NAIAFGHEAAFIAPFHVHLLPVVTRKIQTQLLDLNIQRIQEVANIPTAHLNMVFGTLGRKLSENAQGIDPRPVIPPSRAPEIVELKIFNNDTNDVELLLGELLTLAENVARRLRHIQMQTRNVRLFLRYSDYKEEQALARLRAPCDTAFDLFNIMQPLLFQAFKRRVRLRQLAVKCADLRPVNRQLSLFDDVAPSKTVQVMDTMEKIRDRFGQNSIRFARAIDKAK